MFMFSLGESDKEPEAVFGRIAGGADTCLRPTSHTPHSRHYLSIWVKLCPAILVTLSLISSNNRRSKLVCLWNFECKGWRVFVIAQ